MLFLNISSKRDSGVQDLGLWSDPEVASIARFRLGAKYLHLSWIVRGFAARQNPHEDFLLGAATLEYPFHACWVFLVRAAQDD